MLEHWTVPGCWNIVSNILQRCLNTCWNIGSNLQNKDICFSNNATNTNTQQTTLTDPLHYLVGVDGQGWHWERHLFAWKEDQLEQCVSSLHNIFCRIMLFINGSRFIPLMKATLSNRHIRLLLAWSSPILIFIHNWFGIKQCLWKCHYLLWEF